jgi:hypothetical protein
VAPGPGFSSKWTSRTLGQEVSCSFGLHSLGRGLSHLGPLRGSVSPKGKSQNAHEHAGYPPRYRRSPGRSEATLRDCLEIDRFSTDVIELAVGGVQRSARVCSWHSYGVEASARSCTRGDCQLAAEGAARQRSRSASRTARSQRSGPADRSHTSRNRALLFRDR